MQPNWRLCPEIVREGIDAWVANAAPPGGFLQAVLLNDLKESFARADCTNGQAMCHIIAYLYWKAPAICWGSVKNIGEWAAAGGAKGLKESEYVAPKPVAYIDNVVDCEFEGKS